MKWLFGLGDFYEHAGEKLDGFEDVHGGNGIGKRNEEGRMLLEFVTKENYLWQTRGLRRRIKER